MFRAPSWQTKSYEEIMIKLNKCGLTTIFGYNRTQCKELVTGKVPYERGDLPTTLERHEDTLNVIPTRIVVKEKP
jgi:hypothetical protein